ncbi:hypothetical protein C1H46_000484 [Malus baccata]|uniref:Pectate lyase n=1 Tax=Malus baccata TaxID=106549 RepID=A0A540NT77_MALBA|nr:hypothetical protein C1H46_000484 [Malus baccata]
MGNSSLEFLDVRLLCLLSMFCMASGFGRGVKAEGRSLLQHHNKAKSSNLFNVKSFGARADGRTDDSDGYLKATTDLRKYGSGGGWIEFAWMKGLTLTGGGTFDGRGAHAWPHNKCITNSNCKLLPTVCSTASSLNPYVDIGSETKLIKEANAQKLMRCYKIAEKGAFLTINSIGEKL